MRRYASARDSVAWEEFLKASEGLQTWMKVQSPNLTTAREKGLLSQNGRGARSYFAKGK